MSKTKKRKIKLAKNPLKAKAFRRARKIKKNKRPTKSRKILIKKSKAKKTKKAIKIKRGKILRKKPKIRKPKAKLVRRKAKAKKVARKMRKRKVANKPGKRVVRKIKRVVARKQVESAPETFSAESLFRAKIKVVGVGGGGGSIVSEIGRSLQKATFVVADTDIRALKKKSGIKYLWFGQELTHGLGTGVNVDVAKQAAEGAKEKISAYFKEQDIVIFVASLGGGLGSGATQVFAEAAREFGGITFGIFTMPFKFEGKNKQRIALNALKALRQTLNVSLVIPNEKIFKVIDESTPITTAFSTVNKSLIGSLESLIDLIYNPGIINIDFADLRTILRGKGNFAFLNTVEESGKNRVEKICENIFKNPLLQSSGFEAERILFNIAGAENLSMFEVEKISSYISNFNPKAKIIFGISKNSKLKNKIKTTILMTGLPAGTALKEEPVVKEKVVVESKKPDKPPQKKVKKKLKSDVRPGVGQKQTASIPVFEVPALEVAATASVQKILADNPSQEDGRKTIRRSALEIKKAEELQEKKRMDQEKEWETPAFLRRIKFKA